MELKNSDFITLKNFMYKNYGINLENKKSLVEARLVLYIKKLGFNSFKEYIDNLVEDKSGKYVSVLVERLTTNFTYFMREEKHFDFLRDEVLLKNSDNKEFKIWSAASSTGEEIYCIAMLIESLKYKRLNIKTDLVATDISKNVLYQASKGEYSKSKINKIPNLWVKNYFTQINTNTYKVNDNIRKMIKFGYFNLNNNMGWTKNTYDVIFCRNVMIYFDIQTKEKLCKRLYDSLKPGGYLIIGMSETISNLKTDFKCIKPSIYKK